MAFRRSTVRSRSAPPILDRDTQPLAVLHGIEPSTVGGTGGAVRPPHKNSRRNRHPSAARRDGSIPFSSTNTSPPLAPEAHHYGATFRRSLRLPQREPPPSLRSGDYSRCERSQHRKEIEARGLTHVGSPTRRLRSLLKHITTGRPSVARSGSRNATFRSSRDRATESAPVNRTRGLTHVGSSLPASAALQEKEGPAVGDSGARNVGSETRKTTRSEICPENQFGRSTVSITWMTPLLQRMSAPTTSAPPTVTVPPSERIASGFPLTVVAEVIPATCAASTRPGTT